MAKVHNELLGNHNRIHAAIGNDKLADARTLMLESIAMIDTVIGTPRPSSVSRRHEPDTPKATKKSKGKDD